MIRNGALRKERKKERKRTEGDGDWLQFYCTGQFSKVCWIRFSQVSGHVGLEHCKWTGGRM